MRATGRVTEQAPALAAIGLGANLGDRLATLRAAAAKIAAIPRIELVARSRVYETPPAGGPPQPDYLNAAVLVRTDLPPVDILAKMLIIEQSLGRTRPDPMRWGPRTIDLDLLWSSSGPVNEPGLVVPHPRLAERPFAVQPLLDVMPGLAEYAESPAARALIRVVAYL